MLKKNLLNLPSFKSSDLTSNFFIFTRIIAAFFSFPCITDVGNYFSWFVKLQLGLIPYSQFSFEYPPLTLIPIYFAGIFNPQSFEEYYLGFAFLLLCTDFFLLKICKSYCKNKLALNENEISYMVLLYSLFGLLLFRILYHRLDLILALFFITSLAFFDAKNSKLKNAFFINSLLAFFYKIVPAFIMPSCIIAKAFATNFPIKKIISNSLIFLAALFAITLALENFTNHHFIENMLFHQRRGIQIESSYGSLLLLKNLLKIGTYSEVYSGFGAWNIGSNDYFEIIAKILGNLIFLIFWAALFLVLLGKKNARQKINFSDAQFLELTLITILLFLAFQRVLSMQFFIWLIPVSAIWLAKNRSVKFLMVFCFLFLSSFFIFSIDYLALIAQLPMMVMIIFSRNLVLVIFSCWLTVNFLKKLRHDN